MYLQQRQKDEKLWAALAHGSIAINLALPLLGIGAIAALGIWLYRRRVSAYTGYEALQAFLFQAIIIFVSIVAGYIEGVALILLLVAGIVYGLYGAYRCYKGYDFRYLYLGDFITSIRSRQ